MSIFILVCVPLTCKKPGTVQKILFKKSNPDRFECCISLFLVLKLETYFPDLSSVPTTYIPTQQLKRPR